MQKEIRFLPEIANLTAWAFHNDRRAEKV